MYRFLASLAGALLLVSMTKLAPAEDWPRWRGPRGDGTWQAPKLPAQWPADGLKRRWRQPIGGGYAGVVASDGLVYTMDRQRKPGEAERVLAYRADNGEPVWQHAYPVAYGDLDYGNGPRAAPTIFEDRVYTLGAVGHAYCLDVRTGEVIWSKDFVRDYAAQLPEWGLAASPVVFENLVILQPGVRPDGCLVALDRATGQEVWRASTDPAGYATPILIERAGQPQLICWTPEHVIGVQPRDGKMLWSIPYKVTYGVSIATPIFAEDLVFVSGYWEGSKAIRLGQEPGNVELAWENERELRGLMSQPLYRQGYVYSLDKTLGLTCFELASGRKLWDDGNQLTPRDRNPQASLVWLGDEDRAIALNANGELVLFRLRPAGYVEESRTNIIGPTWAHPAYTERAVFARDDSELVCVELPAVDAPSSSNAGGGN
ncbi:MAG: PQQ-binding-like beta-propeller repeat protein [Pirellulales bacterium]|nr:PQQ-binding-like beta-propeller repeat protein [Pirellulales bacterium]